MLTNLIDVKMVKVLDNTFGILMNVSLERLIVYKLDFDFGSNVDIENYSECTQRHVQLSHFSIIKSVAWEKKVHFVCSR